MDKNFDDDRELWWGNEYYYDRIKALSITVDISENKDPITSRIIVYFNALKRNVLIVIDLIKN